MCALWIQHTLQQTDGQTDLANEYTPMISNLHYYMKKKNYVYDSNHSVKQTVHHSTKTVNAILVLNTNFFLHE